MADEATAPDLVASTGEQDQNSPWNGLLSSAVTAGLNVGNNYVQKVLGAQTPIASSPVAPSQPAAQAVASAPAKSGTSWLPIVLIGGLVLAVIAWFAFGRD